jgi:hypothetical protein
MLIQFPCTSTIDIPLLWDKIIEVPVKEEYIIAAQIFANKMAIGGDTLYLKQDIGLTPETRDAQSYYSKVGEFCVYNHLINRIKAIQDEWYERDDHASNKELQYLMKIKTDAPDCKIYEAKDKSWAADVRVEHIGFHIKSYWSNPYDADKESWVFQKYLNKRVDDVLDLENALCCFCTLDNKLEKALLFPPIRIGEITWGIPYSENHKHDKKAVYAKDNFQKQIVEHLESKK